MASLLLQYHSFSAKIDDCSFSWTPDTKTPWWCITVSYAYKLHTPILEFWPMSFMESMDRMAPETKPWGMLIFRMAFLRWTLLWDTTCVLFPNYKPVQLNIFHALIFHLFDQVIVIYGIETFLYLTKKQMPLSKWSHIFSIQKSTTLCNAAYKVNVLFSLAFTTLPSQFSLSWSDHSST